MVLGGSLACEEKEQLQKRNYVTMINEEKIGLQLFVQASGLVTFRM